MNEIQCRAYLLGQLPSADAEQLETRVLQDDEVFQTLRGVEDDLFDAFARGRLTRDEREQFLARFGDRADRIAFAHALNARVRRASGWQTAWVPLAVAAAVFLAVGISWWMRPVPVPVPPTVVTKEPPPAPAVPPVVALITLGTSRAAENSTTITLPAATPGVQLRVRLNPADTFDGYTMELRSSADRIVWRRENLQASASPGELVVTGTVPAGVLEAGVYELAVRGGTTDLGFVTVRIMRTP